MFILWHSDKGPSFSESGFPSRFVTRLDRLIGQGRIDFELDQDQEPGVLEEPGSMGEIPAEANSERNLRPLACAPPDFLRQSSPPVRGMSELRLSVVTWCGMFFRPPFRIFATATRIFATVTSYCPRLFRGSRRL